MDDYECFLCGADDSCIDLHEFDSPDMPSNEWICSECLTNGDADDLNGEVA